MATLTGKLSDVTSKVPENISSITVKAPSARIGSGTGVIVSSPATVDFNRSTGDITISGLTGGLSWLYIEGDGWSDSIPLAVAEGMITLVEAVANAAGTPGIIDYVNLINNAESAIQDFINGLELDTYGGFQDASVNVDTLLAGGTNSNSRVYYRMASGGSTPDGGAGVLDVTSAGHLFTQVFYSTTNNAIYQRTINDRSHIVPGEWIFGEWKKLSTHDEVSAKADKSELAAKADKTEIDPKIDDKLRPPMLDNTTHLNTVTSIGTYAQEASGTSLGSIGYPSNKSGMLEVLNPYLNGTHGLTVQRYTTYDGECYWRAKLAGNSWESWETVASVSLVDDKLRPVMLDNSTHLDTVTSIGTYAQEASVTDDSRFALGYPARGSGMLEVLNPFLNGTHGLTIQRYTTHAGSSYWRAKLASTWGEWQQTLSAGSTYTKSEIDSLLQSVEPVGAVQSDAIQRIVVSDDASAPTNTGDLLLVYEKPLSRFAQTFDGDFTSRWTTATWNLGATAEVSPATAGKTALSYDALGTPVDVELVTRMTSSNHAGAGHGLVARADDNNGYYAWVGDGKINLNGWDAGAYFGITSKTLPFTIADNDWIWLRFRVFGSTLAAKAWPDGQAEPADWDLTTRHTRVTSAGWAGVNTNRAGSHVWDLLGGALDGAAAPKE